MRKKIIKLLLIIVMTISLIACEKQEMNNYKLKVIKSSWSGWDEDYFPEDKTFEYDIELNKEYEVSKGSLGLTFTIKKINKDNIVIDTTEPFSDSEKGISLRTDKTEFVIEKGKTLKLTTPTMDAGNIYYLSLEKVK